MKKFALSLLLSLFVGGALAQAPPNFGGSMVPNGGAGGGGGSVLCANLPALTGDVTTSAGSCATVLATTIGGPHTWTGPQTINLNSGSPPTPSTGTLLQTVGADATVARIETDSFGAAAFFSARRANGTAASPTAIANSDQIGAFNWHGYYVTGGPAYSGPQASISALATQAWTSTANGTKVTISTTPNNSVTLGVALTIDQDKSIAMAGSATVATSLAIAGATPGTNIFAATGTGTFSGGLTAAPSNSAGADIAAVHNGITIGSVGTLNFSAGLPTSVGDGNLNRLSAGLLQIGTGGSANALGSLNLVNLTASGVVFTGQSGSDYAAALFQSLRLGQTRTITWSNTDLSPGGGTADLILGRAASATLRHGDADVSSGAIAQFVTFQGNTGASTTGPKGTIKGAVGGSGAASVGGEVSIVGGITSAAAGTGGAVSLYGGGALGSGTTPVLGLTVAANGAVATPVSVVIGGATPGTNTLSVTGVANFGGGGASNNGWTFDSSVGTLNYLVSGTSRLAFTDSTSLKVLNSYSVLWSNSGSGVATIDTSLSRSAAGILQVGTTAANALGSLNLTNLTAGNNLTLGNQLIWLSASNMYGAIDGTMQFQNSAGTHLISLSFPLNAVFQLGPLDVASGAVAQTLQFQGNTGSATTGPLALIKGSAGGSGASTGGELRLQGGTPTAGVGGAITFYTSATTTPAVALTIANDKTATFNGNVVGTGAISGNQLTAVVNFSAGSGSSGIVYTPSSDGVLKLTNWAQTDFGRLQLGGTSASFPSWKRSTTIIQCRLADDSAYCPTEASTIRTATAFTVSTLPAAGTAGRRAYVTDQLTTCAGVGVALTGGGAVVCPAFDNGVAWVGGFLYMPGVFGPRGVPANDNSFPMQMTG